MRVPPAIRLIALLTVAAPILFFYFSYQYSRKSEVSIHLIDQKQKLIERATALRASLLQQRSSLPYILISGKGSALEAVREARSQTESDIRALASLGSEKAGLDDLHRLLLKNHAVEDSVLALYSTDTRAALNKLSGNGYAVALDRNLSGMILNEKKQLAQYSADQRAHEKNRLRSILWSGGWGFVFFLVLLMMIIRANRKQQLAETAFRENEMKYRDLIENSASVTFTTDLEGNFIFTSNKCLELTGFSAEELKGKNFTMLIPEAWHDTVRAFYAGQASTDLPETQFRFPVITKEGIDKWVEQQCVLMKEAGVPTGFQCIVKDITETKLGEDLLRHAEAKLQSQQEEHRYRMQAILDNMPMIVYIKDLEGRFLLVNKRLKEIFNMSDEMVIGKKVHEIIEGASADKFAAADEEIKRTLKPVELEEVMETKEGLRHMLVTKFPLFDREGKLFAISGVDKDITEMVLSREQLVNAKLRAEQAEKLQEEFLANMSHEIRTPMNGIIGMSNLLRETELSSEQKEYVDLVSHSSEILHALINDILDLSRIKAGRMNLEVVEFNVQEVIDNVLAQMKPKTVEKGITLRRNFRTAMPVTVLGDKHKLTQVLNNLVSNAVKFTGRGSVEVKASVAEQDEEFVTLEFIVSDTGMGIGNENLDSIFDNFVQAGSDTVRRFGGTGLGLAITKRLIELQGGNIFASSVLGKGSDFCFKIRYRQAGKSRLVEPLVVGMKKECSLYGKKILLVEDNLVNQKVTFHLLKKAGLELEIADDGSDAVALIEAGNVYDLILMDLQMARMDGFQTTVYIREKLAMDIPIIAMTASALRNEKERCFAVGMNAYLTKPFVPGDLFNELHRFLVNEKEEPRPAVPAARKMYDLAAIRQVRDSGYTIELLQLFLDTTSLLLDAMYDHAIKEEWSGVRVAAHNLKRSAGILQMPQMTEWLTGIELQAGQGSDAGRLMDLLKQVMQEYELMRPMLQAELLEARAQRCN